MREKTLSEFIIEEQRRVPGATGEFTSLLNGIRLTCKRISWLIGQGARGAAISSRPPDEGPLALDAAANQVFLSTFEGGGNLAGLSAKALAAPSLIPASAPRGRYLLLFDALDAASNSDVNVASGSIFSILRAPEGAAEPTAADFLRPGAAQVAAGYALYGPQTMLVLSTGRGVNGFTLDRGFGEFVMSHPALTVPAETRELAVNTSNARFWEPPVQRYVEECVQGQNGPRGEDFTTRWTDSLVAEVHRILIRGGVFLDPADQREGAPAGRLCLLHEVNPMAMLVEQAGGVASTGRGRILQLAPQALHQRVPVLLGSRDEVRRIEAYHSEHDQGLGRAFSSPLFNERSLFPAG